MDPSKVQELFRQAVASDDAVSMREGLERMLGLGEHGGLSPEREYGLRRPDFVMDMPQSRERIRGRDALRKMQEAFPSPAPAMTLRKVTGGRHVWIAEAEMDYGGDRWQTVVIFELDGQGLIARETRYYCREFESPAWRAELVEVMD
ncbi:MAG TPA: hypothetical protein VGF54_20615 [Streptosporangiaceae bacterium]|jgi:hypothetical protein